MNPSVLTRRTVAVVVRHSADCKDKGKGPDWRRCHCPKSLRIYEDGRERRISAKTRSWEVAERFAQEYLDSFDADKQELKRLRTAKERQQVKIEEAIALYLADMAARLGDNGTVAMARSLFGHVDPATKAVLRNGHLLNWLDSLPSTQRPTYMTDFTPTLLASWRASWKFGDYTGAQRWGMVRSFFNFCEAQGWIQDSPARKLRRIQIEKGSRTAIFSDEQYDSVLGAVEKYDPENVPGATRHAWKQRLFTFVELLRWSGMSLIDAVQYRTELVDADGVLRYRRQKTGELATVQLPAHVMALLQSVPLERDSVGAGMPFRMKEYSGHPDTITWRKRLITSIALADIKQVRT